MDTVNNTLDVGKSHEVINELYKQYESDEYMTSKITNYICVQLEGIFENMNRIRLERVARIEDLTSEQDNFIQSFLQNNQYFYAPSTDNFFLLRWFAISTI